MNEISNITPPAGATMSSRDIAELCDKRHPDVLRDIRAMFEALEIGLSSFASSYLNAQNKEQPEYLLPRDLTMTLVTGYSIPLRKKVIDRLDELERSAPAKALNDPAMLRHLLLENVDKVLALEADVKTLTPLAASYEHLTRSDGTFCVTDTAKALNLRPKDLFQWLQSEKWIYRRAGNGHFVGFQSKIGQGLIDHRVQEVTSSDGTTKITEQVRITAKGMAKLGETFGDRVPA